MCVIRKQGRNAVGKEHAGQEARRGERRARNHPVFQGKQHPVRFHGSVIVADDGLHALREADDEHREQDENPVDDAEGAYGQVPAVVRKLPVDGNGHRAAAHVHQARSQSDGQDAGDDGFFQVPDAAAEMDGAGFI